MSVEALKNTFADIKSVEFEKSVFNEITGAYAMYVKRPIKKTNQLVFRLIFGKNLVKPVVIQWRMKRCKLKV